MIRTWKTKTFLLTPALPRSECIPKITRKCTEGWPEIQGEDWRKWFEGSERCKDRQYVERMPSNCQLPTTGNCPRGFWEDLSKLAKHRHAIGLASRCSSISQCSICVLTRLGELCTFKTWCHTCPSCPMVPSEACKSTCFQWTPGASEIQE